ncbi:MAG: ABC transporter ATP-binding protein [Sphingobacteriales bacterium]|nr:ABC transporter ATP-binding protein [Sphingobacteriales bacterium]MBK6891482.1 ABC transporter ATP-binding protein [Sphingobacteriales bacterium]MBK7526685.1 ABC transporter ATP-binding protein [Sphingobacteriales bacterium]MBL0248229.1 ABC transporter ATP-binding protein [Sphingobacteriales bacterium]
MKHPYEIKDTILKIDNISLSLGGKLILNQVNAEIKDLVRPNIEQGQIVGFLGPSGIGKTKLFEIMAGLQQPDSGQVLIGTSLKPVKPGSMGVVQQSYPLFNHRTVKSNLEIAARKGNIPQTERTKRINDLLVRFKLQQQANQYPAQLSGGQRQRIAIAQQLLCSDGFLLLDEPFSGLDIIMIETLSQLLIEIAQQHEHRTIIIVSHDIESTAAIADTLWLMGRNFTEQGQPIDGSHIKYTFNLVELGLAWQQNIIAQPEFHDLVNEVRGLFKKL